jgi:hypothetical protein
MQQDAEYKGYSLGLIRHTNNSIIKQKSQFPAPNFLPSTFYIRVTWLKLHEFKESSEVPACIKLVPINDKIFFA